MYCSNCFFANERERLSFGDECWRNCFNASDARSCRCCGMQASACGRSRWLSGDAVAAAAGLLVAAYDDGTCDFVESALRGRWFGARVVEKREEVVQCGGGV